jgi:hypothetical protein
LTSDAKDGAYLTPNIRNNVIETLVVPTPQFFTAKYQVTIWTQYTQHSNQIIEKIMSSLLPQAQSWKLTTEKGYWFVARLEDGNFSVETNFDDMSSAERFIKHTFTVTVPAYFFATASPGTPVPVKRYVSSPIINFDLSVDSSEIASMTVESEYSMGSDDPTLPLDEQHNNRDDQRTIGWRQQKIYPIHPDINGIVSGDPAAPAVTDDACYDNGYTPLPRGYSLKVVSKNPKGETVFSGASLDSLEIVISDPDIKSRKL